MYNFSEYRPDRVKTGGAYTGWRPRERNFRWIWLLPLLSFPAVMLWSLLK